MLGGQKERKKEAIRPKKIKQAFSVYTVSK